MIWVDFDRADDGSLFTCNADNIVLFMPEPQTPEVTRIVFQGGQSLTVKGSYATVKEIIGRKMPVV